VDGKAIRSTAIKGKPNSALQIITVHMTESGVVLAQETINEKTNEIPVFREMLDHINVKGKVITADALHCQRDTCEKIVDEKRGGDYVFGLKENQENLYRDVKLFFESETDASCYEVFRKIEKNGGRIERRICRKIQDISWLTDHKWPGLKSVFAVQRIVTAQGNTTDETEFYISSLTASAEKLLRISREHWKIESLHWLLDVDFSEDECELLSKNGQESPGSLRKLALLVHRKFVSGLPERKRPSIKTCLLRCLVSEEMFMAVIGNL
jgi:predicted transposase YbfD/YdcC